MSYIVHLNNEKVLVYHPASAFPAEFTEEEAGRLLVASRGLAAENAALRAERDKLQAFKTWVHAYLDVHGVPHHPPGTHGAEGCRIGDRMDWLMAERDKLRGLLGRALAVIESVEGHDFSISNDAEDVLADGGAALAPKP